MRDHKGSIIGVINIGGYYSPTRHVNIRVNQFCILRDAQGVVLFTV